MDYTWGMPVFEYRVRDRSGKVLTASMEAETIAQVREALHSKNLLIVSIKPPRKGLEADINIPGLSNRPPSLKEVAIFSKQLATLINAGVPLVQALAILQKQIENKSFQNILKKVRSDVESGFPLSEAIAKHPRAFNRLYINLVKAGETSGTLDSILGRIAAFQEKELELKGKIKGAMTYPIIVLVIAIGITYFLLTTIVPQFGKMLSDMNAKLPVITQFLMAVSNILQNYGLYVIGFFIILTLIFRAYYKTPVGRHNIDAIKLKLPIFGNLQQKSAIASFARTLGLLLNSGVNIIESLEITKGTANNAIVEETLENAKNVVMVGEPMNASLATSPVFPPMVTSMVAIGEETGSLDDMLGKVADFYDREVDEAVDQLTAAIEPMMIVILGVIVGTIVIGMFLPMFALIGELTKAA